MNFKGSHFPKDVILMSIRWYIAYPLSYRHVEELLDKRGLNVDHATVNRWVVKYSPLLESHFRTIKKAVGKSWRMDETYLKVKGEWVYYYRAVDKQGYTIDFFLSKTRDTNAALTFFKKTITGGAAKADEKCNRNRDFLFVNKNRAGISQLAQENLKNIAIYCKLSPSCNCLFLAVRCRSFKFTSIWGPAEDNGIRLTKETCYTSHEFM